MKKTTLSLIASLLACSTLFSGTTWADGPGGHHEQSWQQQREGGGHHEDRGRGPGPANQRHDNRHDQGGRSPEHRNNRDHFAWNGHDFRRGHVVPHEYRDNIYRVNDWHERGLREPPRGEYWAYIDGNYVLIAAATGIITSLILSNAFH
ncbi:MAG: RcnB family protein [Enterobacterales bacterium endosymbiont of Blomia tropicalis]|uniref:RcnB family protein n=1 Tax=Mixta mediterraneensis TaxID=2758443 RepID=UPI0025A7013B|nr:RcnB family protein [Mixta mediterraneensis]MDL4915356.1 RcnB family protein [Mixta mediterraneensis]